MDYEALLDKWTAEHREEMIEELMEWVRHKSVSRADLADTENKAPYGPDCRAMLDFALKRAADFGFRAEDHDGYCGSALYGDAEEELGFVAHLDVVPEGGNWIYAPYAPVVKDGFIIGRGAGDNKAAAIIGLFLMRFLKENGIRLDKTIRLMMGCAEETGMADFRHYIKAGGKVPEFGIVADAGFPVIYAEKGGWNADILIPAGKNIKDFRAGNVRNAIPDYAELLIDGVTIEEAKEALSGKDGIEAFESDDLVKIVAHGKGGHAASPEGTEDAIVLLAKSVAESSLMEKADLEGLRFIAETFRTPYGDGMGFACEDDITGVLTSNAGVISMEGEKLKLLIDIRYPVKAPIKEMTEKFLLYLEDNDVEMTYLDVEAPFYIEKDDPKVQALMEVYQKVTGDTVSQPGTMGGGTYSRVIPNAITFGPGLPHEDADFLPSGHGFAHAPDEVLHIESWLKAFKIYVISALKLGGAM